MAKRFTDSDKFKGSFIRGLKGSYKLLWEYLNVDCDHAGIWHVDFQIARIYLGEDMPVNEADSLKYFNQGEERIRVLEGGTKWLVLPFIRFQYGELNPKNRAHAAIIKALSSDYQTDDIKPLVSPLQAPCKPLASPLQAPCKPLVSPLQAPCKPHQKGLMR